MKVFENKSIFRKVIIAILIVMIFSFCLSGKVKADDDSDGIGGKLLKPVVSLFLSLGDGLLNIIHSVVVDQNSSLITIDTANGGVLKTILVGIGIAVGVAIIATAIILTAGAVAAAIPALGVSLGAFVAANAGGIILLSTAAGVIGGAVYNSNYLDDDYKLPVYTVSPEEIFSGKITLFDVDFFNPKTSTEVEKVKTENVIKNSISREEARNYFYENGFITSADEDTFGSWYSKLDVTNTDMATSTNYKTTYQTEKDGNTYVIVHSVFQTGILLDESWTISEISTNNVSIEHKSVAYELRSTISTWYKVLRNIAIVALLSILVYIGIRIVISSTGSEKSKYKQMLVDWIVAICLLFVMQYIMSFANLAVEKVIDMLDSIKTPDYIALIPNKNGKVKEGLEDNIDVLSKYKLIPEGGTVDDIMYTIDGMPDDKEYVQWNTNLMGITRLNAQLTKSGTATYAGYTIMFIMMVLFTIYFTFTYLKRILYMAFLTIIAPLVAMTYPIDKMNDGKAQAFEMWLKEYIFNLLIQPMHLLLYTVLVSSALEFAEKNILYSIVAIAFMIPAEKLMRKLFGFEKAQTPGLLGGPAGSALMWSGLNKIMGHTPSKGGKGPKDSIPGGLSENDNQKPTRFSNNFDKVDAAISDNKSEGITNVLGKNRDEDKNIPSIGNNTPIPNEEILNKDSIFGKAKDKFNNLPPVKATNKLTLPYRRAIKAGTKAYVRGMGRKIIRGASKAHPLKKAMRYTAGAAGAITFGAAGGIIGLTSGDATKAFQYGSAGALGGYNMAKGIPNAIHSGLHIDGTSEAVERGYYGTDDKYEEAKKQQYARKIAYSAENIDKMENAGFSREKIREMQETVAQDYVEDGITDFDDIMAGYKLEEQEDGKVTREQVKSAIKHKDLIGDTTKMKEDDKVKWKKTLESNFEKNKRVQEEKLNSQQLAKNTFDLVDNFNNIRNKM